MPTTPQGVDPEVEHTFAGASYHFAAITIQT